MVLVHGFAAPAFRGRVRTGRVRALGHAVSLPAGDGPSRARSARDARQGSVAFLLRDDGPCGPGVLP